MNVFVLIILFFLLGLATRYFLSPPQRLTELLNLFVINIAFPAVILTAVPFMTLSVDALIPLAVYWGLVPICWLLSIGLGRYFNWSGDIRCVCFILLFCGNTGFLGVPMAKAFLEAESIAYVLLYDQFGTFIGLATVVAITIARYENKEAKSDFKKSLIKIITFPPFAFLMASLLLPIAPLVTPVMGLLDGLGQLIVPATMMVVGLQFRLKIEPKYRLPLFIILMTKMIMLPLGVWGVLSLLSVESIMLASVVFQAAAPPMITAAALLISARIAVPLVGSALGVGTILSFFLLPIWGVLLG